MSKLTRQTSEQINDVILVSLLLTSKIFYILFFRWFRTSKCPLGKSSVKDVKRIVKIRLWFLIDCFDSFSQHIYSREIRQFSGLKSWLFTVKQKLRISIYFCPRISYYQKQTQIGILEKYVMFGNVVETSFINSDAFTQTYVPINFTITVMVAEIYS